MIVLTIVVVVTAAANTVIAVADLRQARFVLNNSAAVGIAQDRLPLLATLKLAGAAGLLVGLVGHQLAVPTLALVGIAAALGLVVFYTGALIAHVRARVLHNLYFPGTYWLLAATSLVALING